MSDYDNSNSGALFKNDKQGNEKAPDYKGNINVDGVGKQLAAWIRTSKNGVKYMSLSVSEPYQKQEAAAEPMADLDSEVPF